MNNILIPVNFDDNPGLLLEKGKEIALKFGSRIWLMHVSSPEPDYLGYEVGPQYIIDDKASQLQVENKKLQSFAQRFIAAGIQAEALMVRGATVETILKETIRLNIDLIVIGHHKHYLFYNMFVDGTDAAIINLANVPVLIIPLNTTT